MALSKDRKNEVVTEAAQMLADSKLVVLAKYQGTSVKSLQDLRKTASESNSTVRIMKNRLVKKAMEQDDRLKDIDTAFLTGQLMYAASPSDELAPARIIADFAKNEPQVELVAGITADGSILGIDDVKALADLPTKDQLRGQLAGLIASPLSGLASVLSGNVRGVLNVLSARAEQN